MKLIAAVTTLKLIPLLLAFALLQPSRDFPPDPPNYRPFAHAHEFQPHRDKWLTTRHGGSNNTPGGYWTRVIAYDHQGVYGVDSSYHSYSDLLSQFVFADGNRPCGVGRD